ncbi:MAG: hypothetical protein DMG39_04565 [Acidobacteria bacterium]|nr:MAG: hypothetical protein DMG39_04565 [Acidobacteriota bacterium]
MLPQGPRVVYDGRKMPEPSGNGDNVADVSVDVPIVGAGFSGICMGIKLLEAGIKDFLIIEKSDDLGGT